MKGIPLSLSALLILTLAIAGCQEESILPSADSSETLHDHDNDDYLAGTSIGTCSQGAEGDCCGGRIGNLVWYDANCDGYQDCHTGTEPEPGMQGVEVRLLNAVTGELLGTTYTDSLGHYKFRHLCDGEYFVEIVVPEGYSFTEPFAVTDTTMDSNPNPSLVIIRDENIDKSVDFGLCDRGEGCTPGYWKQDQHFDSWPAPYAPDMLFSDVFEDAFPGLTLVEVLDLNGGGLDALGRHTVAAMLNGASGGVNYQYTDEEVIDMFNDLFPTTTNDYEALKDIFEYNNELGCPLD